MSGLIDSEPITQAENEALVVLNEELAEVNIEVLALIAQLAAKAQQAISKIQRHGFQAGHYDNRTKLEVEIGNFQAALKLLTEYGILSEEKIKTAEYAHFNKLRNFLRHHSHRNTES